MNILDTIFQKCIDGVDALRILDELAHLKKTGTVVVFGLSEFCGTFEIASDNAAFKGLLNAEVKDESEQVFSEDKIHILFLSFENIGLRAYRFPDGAFASDYISRLINADINILSYSAPVSSSIAETARRHFPHAFNHVNKYFEKKLSIVILTGLNNEHKFKETINSFINHFDARDDFEIIVVINGSNDESDLAGLQNLKHKYDLKIVFPKNNLGYGGGMNAGIAIASGKYIALMPDDIEFSKKNCLDPLVDLLDKNSEVGIVGGYFGGYCFSIVDDEIPDGFEMPYWILSVGSASGLQNCNYIKNRYVEVDFASALFMVFRRELGSYDPRYYPYGMEEVAFSLNAKKQGFKVFLTDVGISHDFKSSVTRLEWAKNEKTKMSNNYLPYANSNYQLLASYKDQMRDPVDMFGFALYSLAGQFQRPPNPKITLEDMEGKVETIKL